MIDWKEWREKPINWDILSGCLFPVIVSAIFVISGIVIIIRRLGQ